MNNWCRELRHKECICYSCNSTFFIGSRFECTTCQNYNLCEKCLPQTTHEHVFKEHKRAEKIVFDLCYYGKLEELTNFGFLNFFDTVGWTCTHYAAEGGQLEVLKYLKTKGLDLSSKSLDGFTPMLSACYKGQLEIVKWLYQQGCEISDSDVRLYSCLMYACMRGHLNVVKFLVEQGCSLSGHGLDGYTAAHCSAEGGHLDIFKYLYTTGVDINSVANDGFTPLHSATHQGHLDIVIWLVNVGADVEVRNADGVHALYLAIECGNYRIAEWFMENTNLGSVTDIHNSDCSALMFSCTSCELKFAEHLLSIGYDINKPNKTGCTPLKCSIIAGVEESLIYLIKHGATLKDVNIYTGTTAVKCAAKYQQFEILRYLLFHGGNHLEVLDALENHPDIYDEFKNSVHHAIQLKDYSILEKYKYDDCFLHDIVLNGDLEMLKIFLDQNSEKLDERDEDLNTILNISIIYDQIDIFQFLFKSFQHDWNFRNQEGLTSFEIALQKGNIEILASFQRQNWFDELLFSNFKHIRNMLKTHPDIIQYYKKLKIFKNQNFQDVEFVFQIDKKRKLSGDEPLKKITLL